MSDSFHSEHYVALAENKLLLLNTTRNIFCDKNVADRKWLKMDYSIVFTVFPLFSCCCPPVLNTKLKQSSKLRSISLLRQCFEFPNI